MEKHFVTFYSPGTFVAESTTKPIASWDVEKAIKMALTIEERYSAIPYGFRFSTRKQGRKGLDSKVVKSSGMYYLGGKVETLAQIEARNDPKEEILLRNMCNNKCDKIITNNNSWRWTQPLGKDDVVLDVLRRK